jgi:hypothetical protein
MARRCRHVAILDALSDGAEIPRSPPAPRSTRRTSTRWRIRRQPRSRDDRRWVAGWRARARRDGGLARDIGTRKLARASPARPGGPRARRAVGASPTSRDLDMLDDAPLDVVDLPGRKIADARVGHPSGFHSMTLLVRQNFKMVGEHVTPVLHLARARRPAGLTTAGSGSWRMSVDLPEFEGVRTVLRTASVFGSRSWTRRSCPTTRPRVARRRAATRRRGLARRFPDGAAEA